jgi:DNA-binding transcriptional LysR family regulator
LYQVLDLPSAVSFHRVFEADLSESVLAHLLAGAGMAWLPERLVKNDLNANRLVLLTGLLTVEMQLIFLPQAANSSSVVINSV